MLTLTCQRSRHLAMPADRREGRRMSCRLRQNLVGNIKGIKWDLCELVKWEDRLCKAKRVKIVKKAGNCNNYTDARVHRLDMNEQGDSILRLVWRGVPHSCCREIHGISVHIAAHSDSYGNWAVLRKEERRIFESKKREARAKSECEELEMLAGKNAARQFPEKFKWFQDLPELLQRRS